MVVRGLWEEPSAAAKARCACRWEYLYLRTGAAVCASLHLFFYIQTNVGGKFFPRT